MTSGTSFQLRFNVWGRALSAEPIRALCRPIGRADTGSLSPYRQSRYGLFVALSAEPIRAPSGAIAVGNTHRFFDRSQPPDEYRDEIVQRRVADGLSPMRSERALVVASIVYF